MKLKSILGMLVFSLLFSCYQNSNAQSPDWIWAKTASITGTGYMYNTLVKTDNTNKIFVAGLYKGDFNLGSGVILPGSSEKHIFFAKYNNNGTVQWAKPYGNTGPINVGAITVDISNNVYLTGYFNDWIIAFDTIQVFNAGMFIVKHDYNGNALWCRTGANSTNSAATGMCTDASGNVYATGYFVDSSITFGSTMLPNSGQEDIFIVKYDSSGNELWARSAGGNYSDAPRSITCDKAGNIYITGYFRSTTIAFDSTIINNTAWNTKDLFIAKYDSSGNIIWVKSAGGVHVDEGIALSTDDSANVYMVGSFESAYIAFDTDTILNTSIVSQRTDMIIAKYDSSGNRQWLQSAHGNETEMPTSITTDAAGNSCIAGYFSSGVMTLGSTSLINTDSFSIDLFVARLNRDGNLLWAIRAGTSEEDDVNSITQNGAGDYIMTGRYLDSIKLGTTTLVASAQPNFYLAKLDSAATNANCSTGFTLFPDTVDPHNWYALVQCTGTPPLTYAWNWGDGSQITTGATPTHVYADSAYYNICVTVADGSGCISTYCDSSTYINKTANNSMITLSVVTQLPTGINEQNGNDNAIKVYPNPSNGQVNITSSKNIDEILITNPLGQVVYQSKTSGKNLSLKINDDGIYFVKLTSGKQITTQKIIVQR